MADVIICPHCDKKLRVPESLIGKKVKCPGCAKTFTADAVIEEGGGAPDEQERVTTSRKPKPAAPPPEEEDEEEEVRVRPKRRSMPPPDEEEDEEEEAPRRRQRRDEEEDEEEVPRRRRDEEEDEQQEEEERERRPRRRRGGRKNRDAWLKVRKGLTLIVSGLFAYFVAVAVLVCAGFVVGASLLGAAASSAQGGQPAAGAAAGAGFGVVLALLGALVILAAEGLWIAGLAFCAGAPPKEGAKTLATVSLGLAVLSLLLALAGGGLGMAQGGAAPARPFGAGAGGGAGNVITNVAGLVNLAQMFVFLFFLRALALALREDGMAQGIFMLIIVAGVTLLSFIGMFAILFIGVQPIVGGVFGCLGLVLGLTTFVWYIVVLFRVRSAVGRYAGL
jgi:hypothetical protein